MYIKSKLAVNLPESAGGRACNSLLLWLRLINPSLIWSSLVNIAIIKQSRLQRARPEVVQALWDHNMHEEWLLPVCSWGTQAQCCSWRDSEVDGERDLVPSEDVHRSAPRAGQAASPILNWILYETNLILFQQPHPVLQVLDQVLDPHRRLPLAQVRVDPVDKGLPLDPLLLI